MFYFIFPTHRYLQQLILKTVDFQLRAHRLVLSACSGVFRQLFRLVLLNIQNPGNTKGEVSRTVNLLFDWFGISCMSTDNFCFYLLNRLIQTIQTGGQWYSDTSPFSIPCQNLFRLVRFITSISEVEQVASLNKDDIVEQ
jgi:hypothetical protein